MFKKLLNNLFFLLMTILTLAIFLFIVAVICAITGFESPEELLEKRLNKIENRIEKLENKKGL
jgi:F0F1-type ATP synthase membrane subunit b/b'